MSPFHSISEYPKNVSATGILTRMLDGLGFRLYWATYGLGEKDYAFRPSPDCMSIHELIQHIWGLVNWVSISTTGSHYTKHKEITSIRNAVLEIICNLRVTMESMTEKELSQVQIDGNLFWHIINGPISDALTHVGQINSFRRLAGNPTPNANVFLGTPPNLEAG